MKKILVDQSLDCGIKNLIIVGPCNDREGATKLGNNQSITQKKQKLFRL